jgi:ubiquinone/menaquinone biosynthesis C-methylase UbiE
MNRWSKQGVAYITSMTSQHSVQAHLGMAAKDYDRIIRTWIPGYDQILSTITLWLAQVIPQNGYIVELGGGTGALAEAVLAKLPDARIEIWDVDTNMLAVANDRLRNFTNRVTLREKSFMDTLDECHAVIATLSLHHISTLDAKRAVYGNIHRALAPRGIFLNGDCTIDGTEPTHSVMLCYWLDFMAKHGITETEGRKYLADWAKEDRYQQMFDELTVLAQAGFSRPEVYWREGPLAVYGGIKLQ